MAESLLNLEQMNAMFAAQGGATPAPPTEVAPEIPTPGSGAFISAPLSPERQSALAISQQQMSDEEQRAQFKKDLLYTSVGLITGGSSAAIPKHFSLGPKATVFARAAYEGLTNYATQAIAGDDPSLWEASGAAMLGAGMGMIQAKTARLGVGGKGGEFLKKVGASQHVFDDVLNMKENITHEVLQQKYDLARSFKSSLTVRNPAMDLSENTLKRVNEVLETNPGLEFRMGTKEALSKVPQQTRIKILPAEEAELIRTPGEFGKVTPRRPELVVPTGTRGKLGLTEKRELGAIPENIENANVADVFEYRSKAYQMKNYLEVSARVEDKNAAAELSRHLGTIDKYLDDVVDQARRGAPTAQAAQAIEAYRDANDSAKFQFAQQDIINSFMREGLISTERGNSMLNIDGALTLLGGAVDPAKRGFFVAEKYQPLVKKLQQLPGKQIGADGKPLTTAYNELIDGLYDANTQLGSVFTKKEGRGLQLPLAASVIAGQVTGRTVIGAVAGLQAGTIERVWANALVNPDARQNLIRYAKISGGKVHPGALATILTAIPSAIYGGVTGANAAQPAPGTPIAAEELGSFMGGPGAARP